VRVLSTDADEGTGGVERVRGAVAHVRESVCMYMCVTIAGTTVVDEGTSVHVTVVGAGARAGDQK
jgi:hypothetical protein